MFIVSQLGLGFVGFWVGLGGYVKCFGWWVWVVVVGMVGVMAFMGGYKNKDSSVSFLLV